MTWEIFKHKAKQLRKNRMTEEEIHLECFNELSKREQWIVLNEESDREVSLKIKLLQRYRLKSPKYQEKQKQMELLKEHKKKNQ